jgi:hypothetical protein
MSYLFVHHTLLHLKSHTRYVSSIPSHLSESEKGVFQKLNAILKPNILEVEDISGKKKSHKSKISSLI